MRLYSGEGFAAVALQCILVEFLEAFYQGKIYSPPSGKDIERRARILGLDKAQLKYHLQPNEYRSSSKLFKSFLKNREPFKDFHVTSDLADGFYSNIRCGLLHEAATKEDSIIKNRKEDFPFEKRNRRNLILYRTNFQKHLKSYIANYRNQLLESEELKKALIRKMDDLCQIRRIYYFAYGSNLLKERLKNRIRIYHEHHKGFIKNHSLIFNKRSIDKTSKANIEYRKGCNVWGVCYEIDPEGFDKLAKIEKGYEIKEIAVFLQNDEAKFIVANTFISSDLSKNPPAKEYVDLIVRGAKEHDLPDDYIRQITKKDIKLQ
jgi:hypothetical protein